MLTAVSGIRLASVAAGIKATSSLDLSLIEMREGTRVAAVFTQNAFCAAPVTLAKRHLTQTTPRYLLINSGNANAGTGEPGMQAAQTCCEAVAKAMGCSVEQVLPFSTGVIGQALPVDKIATAVASLKDSLDSQGWATAANAIMTTDTKPKSFSRTITINQQQIQITGIAKGAGMIRPNMATMLAYIATDANIEQAQLQLCLNRAVSQSFNCISIDGDTSTNDAVVLMATGEDEPLSGDALAIFQTALNELCVDLARAIVRDGEGATKLINIHVEQGDSTDECAKVAYAIAHSPLVKTAFFASDPNWGRILAAVGYAGIEQLDIERVQIWLDDVCLVENGGVAPSYTEQQGQSVMQQDEISIRVMLDRGQAHLTIWTCDLSYDYVKINAEYRT